MKNKLLVAALAAGVVAGLMSPVATYAYNLHDALDNNELEYYNVERGLDVSSGGQGSLDLTKLPVVGPPMKLELRLVNNGSDPVNVRIPALDSSFLVPANSERVHYLNVSEVGDHRGVDFSVSQIETAATVPMDISSIQYILDSSYTTFNYETERKYEYQPSQTAAAEETGTVRGYW